MITTLSVFNPAIINAATWLRLTKDVEPNTDITSFFEKEFNCHLVTEACDIVPSKVEFHSDKNLTLFLLKWS